MNKPPIVTTGVTTGRAPANFRNTGAGLPPQFSSNSIRLRNMDPTQPAPGVSLHAGRATRPILIAGINLCYISTNNRSEDLTHEQIHSKNTCDPTCFPPLNH